MRQCEMLQKMFSPKVKKDQSDDRVIDTALSCDGVILH